MIKNETQKERIREALHHYDGDACRPESGITAEDIAALTLGAHYDIAACYCPACVMARRVLDLQKKILELSFLYKD